MYIPSVASIQPLVKWLALCWYRQRRLSAAQLWWLWLITILIHLLLVSGVMLSPPGAPAEGPGDDSAWRLPPGSWPIGLVLLLLVLQPDEAPPFPWLRFRVRRVVRRRRLADMTLEELLALLPPGVRTIAQVVDWLTRSQMVKLLAAILILYPILVELDVEAIIDRYCPTEAEVNIGVVIVILCLNRLIAPQPLLGIADWEAKTVIEELTGVPASKLNDDRLARVLDAIHPHLEEV